MNVSSEKKPVKVLQFTVGGLEFNGIVNFLYQYYKKTDHNVVSFDFVFARQNSMRLVADDPTFQGSRFFELNATTKHNEINYFLLCNRLKKILVEGNYDVLHINTYRIAVTLLCLYLGKKAGIKTIVCHSHNVRRDLPKRKISIKVLLKKIFKSIIVKKSNYMFACSRNAGIALFDENGVCRSNFKVIPDAIDSAKYIFDDNIRDRVRKAANVNEDVFVVGQVGRLTNQKNQLFSVDVLKELLIIVPNAEMWLVGDGNGNYKNEIVNRAKELGVFDRVRFLGECKNVNELMMAMDCLIFPSTFEGLGIVAIEAQATDLSVVASTAITRETKITDSICYLPLNDGAEVWAGEILKCRKRVRVNQQQSVAESGYDIESAVKWMQQFYVDCLNKGTD